MENCEQVQDLKLELIRGYEKYVRTVATLTGASRDEAREAFHRAICRMLVGLTKRPPGNPVIAWRPYIIQSAINALRDEIKERKSVVLFGELREGERQQLLAIPDPRPTPAEQAEKNELAALAWQELDNLAKYERDVITRRCNGQSFREIAWTLSIEPSTARGYWTKGMATLRARFCKAA